MSGGEVTNTNAGSEGEATPDLHPRNFVAGIIDDRVEFEAAVRDLLESGFEEAGLGIRYGAAGIEAFTSRPRHWFEVLSDQSDYLDQFVEALRRGGHAIRVPLAEPLAEQRASARGILVSHGAHHIVSGGRWSFETDPDFGSAR